MIGHHTRSLGPYICLGWEYDDRHRIIGTNSAHTYFSRTCDGGIITMVNRNDSRDYA